MINNPILMDSGAYVWEKYDVLNLYKVQEETSGATSAPSDLVGSMYEGYTFDTATGEFTLTGDVTNVVPGYYASTSKNKIYKYNVFTITIPGTSVTAPTTATIREWDAINAIKESSEKGSTCYGTVTSEDEAAYPADGEQDGYWYVLVGKTGAESGGGSPTLQSKSVTPSESVQNVTPDSGYDGLSKVTVGAIQTETKTVTVNGTVTPSSGKYLKQVTVNVPSSGIDTSDATATADDIAKDKTAYVNGTKVTGTIYTMDEDTGMEATSVSADNTDLVLHYTTTRPRLYRKSNYLRTPLTNLGDATADDVVKGKTFTSATGLKVTGTHVCSGGLNTSDATATAGEILKDKTAYVKGEKITGTIRYYPEGPAITSGGYLTSDVANVSVVTSQTKEYLKITSSQIVNPVAFLKDSKFYCGTLLSNLGNATADDVTEGKTFTSTAGLKVTGTAKASAPTLQSKTATPSTSQQTITPDNGYDGLSSVTVEAMPTAALGTPTISVDSAGKITATVQQASAGYVEAGSKSATKQLTTKGAATITPGTSDQTIASGTYLTGAQTVKGDANLVAGNIKSGVSIFGVAGSFAGSDGGGSSDNNCEAYHITSASSTLNFKTSGTVKVWGYGSKTSTYTTTVYAFVGDGYYAGSSYGTPTKTSASFSVNADGTLSGLPSGLTAVDLLVTIGV